MWRPEEGKWVKVVRTITKEVEVGTGGEGEWVDVALLHAGPFSK